MVSVDRWSTRYKAILQKTSSFQLLRGLSEPNASHFHDCNERKDEGENCFSRMDFFK